MNGYIEVRPQTHSFVHFFLYKHYFPRFSLLADISHGQIFASRDATDPVQPPKKVTTAPPTPLLCPTLPRAFGNQFLPAYPPPQDPHLLTALSLCRRTLISSKFDNKKFHDCPARLLSLDALSVRGRFFCLIAQPLINKSTNNRKVFVHRHTVTYVRNLWI